MKAGTFHDVGYCRLLLRLFTMVPVTNAMMLPRSNRGRIIQSKELFCPADDDDINTAAAPAGGWVIPSLVIKAMTEAVAKGTRT